MAKIKIAIFGGSFNPFTKEHHRIIKDLRKDYAIVYCPVSTGNPFKQSNSLVEYYHRVNMAELVIQENASIFGIRLAQDLALKYPTPLRTWHIVDFVYGYWNKKPKPEIDLIFGEDIENEIDQYEKIDHIRSLVNGIKFVKETNKIHAIDIRRMIAEGDPDWKNHVTVNVSQYIEMHKLFQ